MIGADRRAFMRAFVIVTPDPCIVVRADSWAALGIHFCVAATARRRVDELVLEIGVHASMCARVHVCFPIHVPIAFYPIALHVYALHRWHMR